MKQKSVFGLDLGTSSIGYSVQKLSYDTNRMVSVDVLASGTLIFSDGYNEKKRISKSAERRGFRQTRHLIYGRKLRRRKILRCLCAAGLLDNNHDFKDYFSNTLKKLFEKFFINKSYKLKIINRNTLENRKEMISYLIRSYAIENDIEVDELITGLFFYLNRRGFKSLKRGMSRIKENQNDNSQIKNEINERDKNLINKGLTISQEIILEKPQLKNFYTSRTSHVSEFEAIRKRQSRNPKIPKHFPWDDLKEILFENRPLKSCKHLIGSCSINPSKKRSRIYRTRYQELNLKSEIRNISIIKPISHEKIPLSPKVKQFLFNKAFYGDPVYTDEILEMEALPITKYGSKIIIKETVYDKNVAIKSLIPSTQRKIITAIDDSNEIKTKETKGKKFIKEKIDRKEFEEFVKIINSFDESWQNGVISYLKKNYGEASKFPVRLSDDEIQRLSVVEFDQRFGNIGKEAIDELLMLTKDNWAHISPSEYSGLVENLRKRHQPSSKEVLDFLPHPVDFIKSNHVNSPTVKKAMHNLHKLINALIRKFGKPDEIRIESTRELNKPFDIRQQISFNNERNFKINQIVKDALKNELLIPKPNRDDVTKYKLWYEFNQTCPYCTKPISVGDFENAEIEHFIPNSYLPTKNYKNLAISCRRCNQIKGKRTPWQAFGHDENRWAKIKSNLSYIKENIKNSIYSTSETVFEYKMNRILSKENVPSAGFLESQLNDTRFITKLTSEYLSCLFKNKSSVISVKPTIVHELKKILPKEIFEHYKKITVKYDDNVFQKQRVDHRHHVLDALVVALVDRGFLQKLSQECQEAYFNQKSMKEVKIDIDQQFRFLIDPFKKALDTSGISFGDRIRVRGPLHKQTAERFDEKIKAGIQKGTWVEIIRKGQKYYYENAQVYKFEVWKKLNKTSWERLRALNLYEAHLRRRKKQTLSRCLGNPNEQFIMEFCKGHVLLLNINGQRNLYEVRSFDTTGVVSVASIFDARALDNKNPSLLRLSAKKLYEYNAQRVKLGVLGDYKILKSDEIVQ